VVRHTCFSMAESRVRPPNQALKLTRLPACQLGGPGFVENAAAHWAGTSSAVQLNAGVRPPVGDVADPPRRCDNAGEGSCDESSC
jgi:hypothetical protein